MDNIFWAKTVSTDQCLSSFVLHVTFSLSGSSYATAADRKEIICLSILQKWHTLPVCGYPLVPEHVETRSLFHPNKPGLQQVTHSQKKTFFF